jgi:hypothetical protein
MLLFFPIVLAIAGCVGVSRLYEHTRDFVQKAKIVLTLVKGYEHPHAVAKWMSGKRVLNIEYELHNRKFNYLVPVERTKAHAMTKCKVFLDDKEIHQQPGVPFKFTPEQLGVLRTVHLDEHGFEKDLPLDQVLPVVV